jgi:hypothetical protein
MSDCASTAVMMLLVYVLLCTEVLLAQKGVHVGFRIATQFCRLQNPEDNTADNGVRQTSLGYGGGFHFSYFGEHKIGMGFEMMYSRQGQRYLLRNPETGLNISKSIQTQYIKFPVLFYYNLRKTDSSHMLGYYLFGGPQIGLRLGVRVLVDEKGLYLAGTNLTDDQLFKSTDWGGVVGAGISVRLREVLHLHVSARVDAGLGDAENKAATWRLPVRNNQPGTTARFYDNYYNNLHNMPYAQPLRPRTAISRNFTAAIGIEIRYIIRQPQLERQYWYD